MDQEYSNNLNNTRISTAEEDGSGETDRNKDIALKNDSCQIVQDLIPLHADGVASSASQRFIEAHVKNCLDCLKQLEEARHSLDVLPAETDQKMESALKKVNRKFHHHWMMLAGLTVLCAVLLVSGSILFRRSVQLSADEISVEVTSVSSNEKLLKITSKNGILFGLNVQKDPEGEYSVSACRWKEEKESEKTAVLSDPVNLIYFNQELVWQDGITITPRCRMLFMFAKGYAGSTQQMSLAFPDFTGIEYHILAETENEDHCIWTYFPADENNSKTPDQMMVQSWKKKALLALALTPNLEKICLTGSDDQMLAAVDRIQLKKVLNEADLSENVDSLRDLQLIMNALDGSAG